MRLRSASLTRFPVVNDRNALAARHTRVAICELCECAAAVLFCKQDAASLCKRCSDEVRCTPLDSIITLAQIHTANPLAASHVLEPALPWQPSGTLAAALPGTRVAASAKCERRGRRRHTHLTRRAARNRSRTTSGRWKSWLGARATMGQRQGVAAQPLSPPAVVTPLASGPSSATSLPSSRATSHSRSRFYKLTVRCGAASLLPTKVSYAARRLAPRARQAAGRSRCCCYCGALAAQRSQCATTTRARRGSATGKQQTSRGSFTRRTFSSTPCCELSTENSCVGACVFPQGLSGEFMCREQRVLRYKEKRKNRKFEKTIRCGF